MAFRATNILPETGYDQAKKVATQVKRFSQNRSADLAAGGNSDQLLGTVDTMLIYKEQFATLTTIPGIGDYAKEQEDDPTYDVAAEFTAMLALIDSVISTVTAGFPVDGSDFLLAYTFNPDGSQLARTFTSGQTASVVTALNALDAGIV